MSDNVHAFEHAGDDARLDKVVVERLSPTLMCSRSQVERWIEDGSVLVDGAVVRRPAFKVSEGSRIEVRVAPQLPSHLKPLAFSLEVLWEDEHLLVINKPSGISMHPGAGNDTHTIANAVVHHVGKKQLSVGESDRPGIVHRLDKDTTGVVVVAKSTPVHAALSRQFADRTVGRSYQALVYSTPRAVRAIQASEHGEVVAPIGRHPTNRKMMAIVEEGRPAVTEWRVLERFPHGTLVECTLKTGRTHQIRVHMNSIGSPIIGDQVYGDFSNLPKPLRVAAESFGRQALHAATLSFTHPISKARLSFSAPLPTDLQDLVRVFRERE
jgi:23S rRNA pseudouridine1911/1915/1917 synthase